MKIIRNKLMRLIGKKMLTTPWAIYAAPKANVSEVDINHEEIHAAQQKELLFLVFILWYGIEWFIRLIQFRNSYMAYRNTSFEREAYTNENDMEYLSNRKHFAFIKHLWS